MFDFEPEIQNNYYIYIGRLNEIYQETNTWKDIQLSIPLETFCKELGAGVQNDPQVCNLQRLKANTNIFKIYIQFSGERVIRKRYDWRFGKARASFGRLTKCIWNERNVYMDFTSTPYQTTRAVSYVLADAKHVDSYYTPRGHNSAGPATWAV